MGRLRRLGRLLLIVVVINLRLRLLLRWHGRFLRKLLEKCHDRGVFRRGHGAFLSRDLAFAVDPRDLLSSPRLFSNQSLALALVNSFQELTLKLLLLINDLFHKPLEKLLPLPLPLLLIPPSSADVHVGGSGVRRGRRCRIIREEVSGDVWKRRCSCRGDNSCCYRRRSGEHGAVVVVRS